MHIIDHLLKQERLCMQRMAAQQSQLSELTGLREQAESLLSPVHRLDWDTLSLIFFFVCRNENLLYIRKFCFPAAGLRRVCVSWKLVVDNTPNLYTTLLVKFGSRRLYRPLSIHPPFHFTDRLQAFLSRSATLRLSLSLQQHDSSSSMSKLDNHIPLQLLLETSDRWKSLSLTVTNQVFHYIDRHIRPNIPGISILNVSTYPAPALRSLIANPSEAPSIFGGGFSLKIFTWLKVICFQGFVNDFLSSLELGADILEASYLPSVHIAFPQPRFTTQTTLQFLTLHLRTQLDQVAINYIMQSLCAPSLATLQVRVSNSVYPIWWPPKQKLENFRSLITLHLHGIHIPYPQMEDLLVNLCFLETLMLSEPPFMRCIENSTSTVLSPQLIQRMTYVPSGANASVLAVDIPNIMLRLNHLEIEVNGPYFDDNLFATMVESRQRTSLAVVNNSNMSPLCFLSLTIRKGRLTKEPWQRLVVTGIHLQIKMGSDGAGRYKNSDLDSDSESESEY